MALFIAFVDKNQVAKIKIFPERLFRNVVSGDNRQGF